MIKIDNLTKIYKAKAKTECRAIDGISVTLPERGLVFILGKSGSGKSTLLNLIGGLDSFDGGDIVSFGNSLASFRERDYEAYRSSFVSFIFQDYHLIDELTVLENVTLFGSDEIDRELLDSTLSTVGMEEYVDRYPAELSGGQKQRVAIARGIMKDPRVILCDEPTGNLDRKTSRQILDLLKKISRDKLVVIVSHNLSEAEAYADRIIELADGRIVEDRTKDPSYVDGFLIEQGRATLPYHERMSPDEVDTLNEALRTGEVREISLRPSGFEKSELKYEEQKQELRLRKLGGNNLFRLFKKFFFSKYRAAISTVLISVIMFGVFAVIQAFTKYDAISALEEMMKEDNAVMVIEKDYTTLPLNIYDDLSFLDSENTYPFYNQTIWLQNPYGNSWDNISRMTDDKNLSELYIHENYGLLLCDEDYLIDLYGVDGEIKLLAGGLDGAYESGVLITDYFADSIIRHEIARGKSKYLTYERILGLFCPADVNNAAKIVGIIDTDYEEKYKVIFDTFEELSDSDEELTREDIEKIISDNPIYVDFVDEIKTHLGIAYSLNPDFIDSFNISEITLVRSNSLFFSANGTEVRGSKLNYMTTKTTPLSAKDVADGEIGLPYDIYNMLFGTEYTEKDANILDHVEKRELTVRKYVDDDSDKEVIFDETFTVSFLTVSRLVMSERDMLKVRRADWQPSRIYIKNVKSVDPVFSFVTENGYHLVSREQKNVQRLDELISTFSDLFELLEVTIIVMIALYLIYFGMRSIRQNSYQIGVIKALGGRTRDVSIIFVLKTFIIGVLIAVLSTFVAVSFIGLADRVLVASIEEVIGMRLKDVSIIKAIPTVLAVDALLVIAISFISALLPTLLLKRIKPVDIIKAKE